MSVAALYLVGTPIGNLDDLSPRAIAVLKQADLIACEDTRSSGRLLRNAGVEGPLMSYHQHNEHNKAGEIIEQILRGKSVALVSDAGMPGISDPGFLLTRMAHQRGVKVVPVPGPVAAVTALAASGLPSDRFLFEGFLPAKKGRRGRIQQLSEEEQTVVLYESPHRIVKLMEQFLEVCSPDRWAAFGRELTKMHEEIRRDSLAGLHQELVSRPKQRGEFVFMLAGKSYDET